MSNPLLQELPALVGVGVGAVATFATTSLGEKARWRRERDERWDAARMTAYTEYGNGVKRVFSLAIRMAAARGFPHSVEPLDPDARAMEALSEAEGERTRAWESVLLLGDPETVAAARAWHQEIWRLVWYARGRLTDASEWPAALRESEEARDRFYHCARRDLGVQGEAVRTPGLPRWMGNLTAIDTSND
jgi:hypothetical protein